ncbi:Kinesin-like protein KIF15 [Tetrabaena socialis]|uniref:Kinesin-like protein KIF15 n=1 Tax=Tetrabaena socialis TaxID=47790 RepID=A0A2J8AJH2_9CHLO|nr:Kinesin-like protein KIF15 [Tetrabaena socialis]|eukprot:PNH12660.1 Kinesin-like protein KIF15 [Tetrabaena socialis]
MDFWSKGLRDGTATPRGKAPARPPVQPDKAKPQTTPGIVSNPVSARAYSGTLRKLPPLSMDSPDHSKPDSPSKPASVYSGDGDDGTEDFENDSVRVFVRVRPPTEQELAHEKHEQCLTVIGSRTLQLGTKDKLNHTHRFMFDQVLPEDTTQQDVFDLAGLVAVDNCLAGYNSSIFAYGQTGAGKTFTVIGQINSPEMRGLAPRVFDYLFQKITDHENARGLETVKYNCKCSFLEIYNETIADLLCPASANLPIREDPEKGAFVEALSEPPALNVEEMLQHLIKGADNRHTGETRLNRESSRSHSVFVCTVEKTVTSNGISKCYYARLNLVDLAGSERVASGAHGGSNATGEHLKEACHINKSLTALGRVTTELVKSQKSGGGGHVPYRDSKLTFLLQSSLGGNAKTLIIANVSPSSVCAHETLSTLRFAKQTKHIRNDAKVNWTVQGDRLAMQREIERLRVELSGMRSGITEPLVQANEELTARLGEERHRREDMQQERDRVANALSQSRREVRLLDQRLIGLAGGMDGSRGAAALATMVDQLEVMDASSEQRRQEAAQAEALLMQLQLQLEQAERSRLAAQLSESQHDACAASSKCELLAAEVAALSKTKADLEGSCSTLSESLSQAGVKIAEQEGFIQLQENSLQERRREVLGLEEQLGAERAAREQAEGRLAEQEAAGAASAQAAEAAAAHGAELQLRLNEAEELLAGQGNRMEGLERQLEGALAEATQLQGLLAEVRDQLAQAQRDSTATQGELSDRVSQLTSELQASNTRAAAGEDSLEQQQRELCTTREQVAAQAEQLAQLQQQLAATEAECAAGLERLAAAAAGLAAQSEARGAADDCVASLSTKLDELKEQLAASEAQGAARAEELRQAQEATAALEQELGSKVADLTARTADMQGSAEQQAAAHSALEERMLEAQRTVQQLEEAVTELRAQLGVVGGEKAASEAHAAELQAQVLGLEEAKSELLALTSKQGSEAQDRAATVAQLEARIADLEAAKAVLGEQFGQEQATATSLREAVARHEACILELRQQKEQEETRTLGTLREMSESAAASQRQLSCLEEQHLQEVQALKNELDRRNSDLKSRDQEMVRTNFALKGEIDRLQGSLEQSKRDLAANKATQEQLAASHQAVVAGMAERLTKSAERYNELSKRHDSVKQLLDHTQREIDSWKTKSERLDHAMADVTRLIRFARNPPDSARSSLIMTRSDHLSPNVESARRLSGMSGSRGGPATTMTTAGSLSLRISESPAGSPRVSTSRYSAAASPAGSKVGSVTASHRIDAGDDDSEWEATSRRVRDVVSLGDQLPMPALDMDADV